MSESREQPWVLRGLRAMVRALETEFRLELEGAKMAIEHSEVTHKALCKMYAEEAQKKMLEAILNVPLDRDHVRKELKKRGWVEKKVSCCPTCGHMVEED